MPNFESEGYHYMNKMKFSISFIVETQAEYFHLFA